MLARCLTQSMRTTSFLNRSSKTILFVRDNVKHQLIVDRRLTTNPIRFNESKDNSSSKLNNYERLREKLKTRTKFEAQDLKEFEEELSQLGIVQKFKKIVSEYWHVIICVHAVTSAIWFSIMCLIKYQFDLTPEPLIKFLTQYNVPAFILQPLRNTYLQMIAVPFFLYKCVTPIRYYTTIYTTMVAIRRLMPRGIIKAKETPRIIQMMYGKYKKKSN